MVFKIRSLILVSDVASPVRWSLVATADHATSTSSVSKDGTVSRRRLILVIAVFLGPMILSLRRAFLLIKSFEDKVIIIPVAVLQISLGRRNTLLVRMIASLSWQDISKRKTCTTGGTQLADFLCELNVLESHLQLLIGSLQVLNVVLLHHADRKDLVVVFLQSLILRHIL